MQLVCGHKSESTQLFESRDYITGDNFPIIRCNQCELIQTQVDFENTDYSNYYPTAYYGESKRYNFILTKITRMLAKYRLRLIKNHLKPGSKILDIGCGQGWVLDELAKMGHQVHGVEFSEVAAFHASKILNLDIRVGDVRNLDFSSEKFDCIIIWHVLEHASQPEQLLNHIHGLLNPNGVLLLSVPDFSSVEAKLTQTHWFHLDPPRHLSHFEKFNLIAHLNNQGFKIIKKSSFIPEYDFFSIIQSFLNKLGLQKNALYAFLRSSSNGSIMKNQLKPSSLIISLLLLPILIPISIVWVPVVSLKSTGATQTYVLKKPE